MRAILVALILLALIVLVLGCARTCLRRRGSVRLSRLLRPGDPARPTIVPTAGWRASDCQRRHHSAPCAPGARAGVGAGHPAASRPTALPAGNPAAATTVSPTPVHALVADGHHGRSDRIQDFRCQACGSRVTARRGTALYQLKTPPARIGEVLSALAEGLDIGAAVRVFGHGETTITRWRDRAARHAERVHRHFLHGLHLPHLQLDEIRARLRRCDRVTWLWLALDPRTKLIPALALGPRTQQTAHSLVHTLRAALAAGMHAGDHHRRAAPLLLRAHRALRPVGHLQVAAAAGRSIPRSCTANCTSATAAAASCASATRWAAAPDAPSAATLRCLGWSGKLQTAFVERVNLTARMSVAALTRRTWATAQTAAGLQRQVAWWRAYYHFSRPHRSLRQDGRARTPAMAAGLTTHRWTVRRVPGLSLRPSRVMGSGSASRWWRARTIIQRHIGIDGG